MTPNPMFLNSLEQGHDCVFYDDDGSENEFCLNAFVRLYKMGIPGVCWLIHNGKVEAYWSQWQIFDLIRQNDIHPKWMRKEDHDELYKNIIPSGVEVHREEFTGYPLRNEHGEHHRRRRTRS